MPVNLPLEAHFDILMEKYIENSCTRQELEELLSMIGKEEKSEDLSIAMKKRWMKSPPGQVVSDEILASKFAGLMEEAMKIDNGSTESKLKVKRLSGAIPYAAAILLFCLLSLFLYYKFTPKQTGQIVDNLPDTNEIRNILPGGNKAILTLSNGQIIDLNNSQNGALVTQSNIKIEKSNGLLSYSPENDQTSQMLFNTVSTPNGGQYQLILSDGTKVWLNAASSLRYPVSFKANERRVELTGEAYFEVTSNKKKPFRVFSKDMEVTVLGTHFNINAYSNEASAQTTLLEGSVRVNVQNNVSLLKPGQQARVFPSHDIKVINDVETEAVIAWKNEKFQFVRADIKTVMRQIERWYDVTVEYDANISTHFGGSISRNVNLDQVLNILQQTDKVKFEVKGNKVIVLSPNVKK